MKNQELRQTFFSNKLDRIFSIKLAWNIGQPFVCGTLKEIIKYALQPNNGIEGIFEIDGMKFKRVSKKQLKEIKEKTFDDELAELLKELEKKY